MKLFVLQIVLCLASRYLVHALSSEEISEVTDTCCSLGETRALAAASAKECAGAGPPEDIEPEQTVVCLAALTSCCERQVKNKEECAAGMRLAAAKRCSIPRSELGRTCCEECSLGTWTGESQGREACGDPVEGGYSANSALRKNAYHQCCVQAADKPETTTEKKIETTTEKKIETTTKKKEKCTPESCEQVCSDDDGKIRCSCDEGYRLQADKRSCKDINECAEAIDDLCTAESTVCHNTPGSFKCVPLKKREVGLSCPPGFKRNVVNQVCDDINECQLPRPPCPKYLCENTIGGYKCGGKPGKPAIEAEPGLTTEAGVATTPAKSDNMCPPGFRAGPDDECLDIDECEEHLDDCQRLSQHCINSYGNFFCQDHVSKRCSPGFKVNAGTGVCEDIDECEDSETCKRTEVCQNLPGAYVCNSKISTLPKLATKKCQEGTRVRPGGSACEDIDECREGTHLCDQFQNCINTYGAHECRCKNGFEIDSSGSGSCVDIDECALKLDNCGPGQYCLNVIGTFTCTRRPPTTSTKPPTPPPMYDYDYYSDEDNSTDTNDTIDDVKPTTTSTTTPRPTRPTISTTTTPRPTTPRPTRPPYRPRTTSTTTPVPFTRPTRRPYSPRPETRPTPRPYTPPAEPTRPVRPETTPRPELRPYYPPRLGSRPAIPIPGRTTETVVEVTVPAPEERPNVIETEPSPEGGYSIDTGDIPTDKWTNLAAPKPEQPTEVRPDFDPAQLHCLNGYERNATGQCVDINECEDNRHICSNLEECVNRVGDYVCECIAGFRRDPSGWCVVVTTPRTSTTSTTSTTQRPAVTTPDWYPPAPRPRTHGNEGRVACELGYKYDHGRGKCVDIDECATNKANCSPQEECVNYDGGYRCVCGRRCRTPSVPTTTETAKPTYVAPPRDSGPDSNVITVGAQYGQRGSRYMRPNYKRLPNTGAVVATCSWGYKLTPEKLCLDIDECAKNSSECGPQQRCENFYGGYSCSCPAGHRLVGQDQCEDVDECRYAQPCPYNSECVNIVGSYRCACGEGFRNAPSNDKVCVDVDECADTPSVCEHACANVWGGYRCYCKRGYRLHNDNHTCVDIDECAEWSSARVRGRLCGGECVNEPGSYRCSCPQGYRLSEDGRSCIDIDECETGEATCARGSPGEVCQNTRGSYHCHQIDCPLGYRLESKHRCSRIQRSCPVSDWSCLHQPSSYSYNFITFVANIYIPDGSVDLFTMHGPNWFDSVVNFEMRMVDVQASRAVRPADLSCFDMRPSNNICVISLLCSLEGPQVAELELTMSLYQRGHFAGSAVARLVVIVSQYEF